MNAFDFLIILLVAMSVVSLAFIVVTGLMVTAIFSRTCGRRSSEAETPAQGAPSPQQAVPPPPAALAASGDDDEIVSVISAVIAAVCGGGARVVGIGPSTPERTAPSSVWRAAARVESFEGL
ncbi:MAG: OadG family protein [Synergistaceae bacterium]|jgi:hypothetical protein|nr:OadG family protein [Synergistaceae bacterium]